MINSTIHSGGGSPSLLFVDMSPVPQGGVWPFIVLSYRYRLSFYRYRYRIIETLSIRDFIISLSNDIIESFDTISNTNLLLLILLYQVLLIQ